MRPRNRSKSKEREVKPCRYCKLHGRTRAHPKIAEAKCNWNKKSNFWQPECVAKKMGVPYVMRNKFDKDHGGWRDDDRN